MSSTEIWLIIITAVLAATAVLGILAMFTVGYFKEHRGGTGFAVLILFVASAIAASTAAAVHYGLVGKGIAASALLGACGALAVVAVLIIMGVTTVTRRIKMSVLTGTVILIVLMLQIAINIVNPYDFGSGEPLDGGAVFARVISGTFQYFTVDADYADLIRIGSATLPRGGICVFYILSCSMTVIAPIVGGFAIFGALGHFFPKLSLWRNIQPTKYVFSELNEYSIETAESIVELKNKLASSKAERERYIDRYGKALYDEVMRSVIIFTDVYSDQKEESAELLQRAVNINAICLKDDIIARKIYWIAGRLYRLFTHTQKKVVYFLMDKSDFYVEQGEENNLRNAVELFTTDRRRMIWEKTNFFQAGMKAQAVEIYVFSRNESADSILKEAYNKWYKQFGGRQSVAFKTINEYQSLVYGLIDGAFPLYMALEQPRNSGAYNTEKLSVLIIGGGRIAKTFWKTVYRSGQMLCGNVPTKLRIATLSMDAQDTESRLKFDMPAVFAPDICDYSSDPNSYCEYKFIPSTYGTEQFASQFRDVVSGKVWGLNGNGIDVDYILIALGADNLNMQAADFVKRELCRSSATAKKIVPINYVIENTALSSAIGGKSGEEKECAVCVLNPFGALKERFSFSNISMTELERRALLANKAYCDDKGKRSLGVDAYSRDSSIAAAIHSSYKTACMSVFDDDFERRAFWLEHRRWTAYLRSIGYRNYTANEFARMLDFKEKDKYTYIVTKNAELKLHACITECSDAITDTATIQAYLEDHPEFIDTALKTLDDIKNGKTVRLKSGAAVESMDDFYGFMRESFGCGFDNLDIVSLMASGVNYSNKQKPFKAANYKPYDLDIVKRLRFDVMCDRIADCLFDDSSVEDISSAVEQIVRLYKNEFKPQTDDARCENNPAVLCRRGGLFAFVGRRHGYDIILWQTDESGIAAVEKLRDGKAGFVVRADGGDHAIIAVPQCDTVKLIGNNGQLFDACVLKSGMFEVTAQ